MSYETRYAWVITLIFATFASGMIGSLLTNSVAVYSGALHLMADVVPPLLGYMSLRKQRRKGSGFDDRSITMSNVVTLAFAAIIIGLKIHDRSEHFEAVSRWMLLFAGIEMIGNFAQFWVGRPLLHAHKHHHAGLGQYLHLLFDFLASVCVLGGAVWFYFSGSPWVDLAAAVMVVVATLVVIIWLLFEMTSDDTNSRGYRSHRH